MDIGFIIITGLLTSFHCVAMCGTMVATYAIKDGGLSDKRFDATPHLVYHSARLVSYTVVGLALGLIGGAFNLGGIRGGASLLAGTFMVLLGLNMLNVHPIFRMFSLRMPRKLQQMMFRGSGEGTDRLGAPLLFGAMTGLMPCGPLQAMQLYAAGTGSAFLGAATMLLFGAMTIPMMLAMGAATQMLGHAFKKRVMTVGALVVIVLGLTMVNRGLVLEGSPFTAKTIQTSVATSLGFGKAPGGVAATAGGGVQKATIVIQNTTYQPDTVTLQAGVPVELTIDRRENNACSDSLVIPSQGINTTLKPFGKTVVRFTPGGPGQIPFTCGMGMMQGTFVVNASGEAVASAGGAGAGGGTAAGAGAGGTAAGGGPSEQGVAANRILALFLLAMAGFVGYKKWRSRTLARRAETEAQAKANARPRAGKRQRVPASRKGRASRPEPAPVPAWKQQYVWVSALIIIAVVAGYGTGVASRPQPAGSASLGGPVAGAAEATLDPGGRFQSAPLTVAGGYDPASITAKAGIPLKLIVARHEQNGCSKYLVFPDLGLKTELPDDGQLSVDIPALRAGTYRFTCQMNMLSGQLVVQ
jgi:sulfite exporter TauE/SafE/plastocyanin domain-containing protein